jgi:hypothetical protein
VDPPPPRIGELLRIDDLETGFSPENPKTRRPYLVVGRPAGRQLPLRPLSTKGGAVYVPEDGADGLGEESWIVEKHVVVPLSVAWEADSAGWLEDPYLAEALAMVKK